MSIKIFSGAAVGIEGHVVEVEAAHSRGLRNFLIVGLPDAAVKEARERVAAALKFSGYEMPRGRIAVNLAPAHIKKQGTTYDLPIALSVLSATGVINREQIIKSMFVGELALDGAVRPVQCVLLYTLAAKSFGLENIFVPKENVAEALLVKGINVYAIDTLHSVVEHLLGVNKFDPQIAKEKGFVNQASDFDMAFVRGQESTKRALEIAAAGRHNILMFGPPGTGKTLLARTLPTILPSMNDDEAIEVTKIHSVAGILPIGSGLVIERPFRSPHHTVSGVALIGGGTNPKPGEISMANHGVLFLDEFPEFSRSAIENLRQPLEDGVVTVSRAAGTIQYPAKFMLVASMNPCPCGYYGDIKNKCTCSSYNLERYRKRISGPLLDRIDMMIEVPRIEYEKLISVDLGEQSSKIRERVEKVYSIYLQRGPVNPQTIGKICRLDEEGNYFMKQAMEKMHLSIRSYGRVLKVARTIADLASSEMIKVEHLAEALQFRPKINRN